MGLLRLRDLGLKTVGLLAEGGWDSSSWPELLSFELQQEFFSDVINLLSGKWGWTCKLTGPVPRWLCPLPLCWWWWCRWWLCWWCEWLQIEWSSWQPVKWHIWWIFSCDEHWDYIGQSVSTILSSTSPRSSYRNARATRGVGAVARRGQRSNWPTTTAVKDIRFLAVDGGHECEVIKGRHVARTIQGTA